MKLLCAVLALAGCVDTDDHPPIQPGGGGGGGTGIPSPSEDTITGNVCVVEDLIIRVSCGSGAGGLSVSLGGNTTTTFPDGSFILPRPSGSLLSFEVSGPGAVTTTTPYSPSLTIPVVNADVWAATMASNQISLPDGAGSILGTVVRDGAPVEGVSVVSTPSGISGPFYDGSPGFGIDRTGARGVFLVPGITGASTSLAFSPGESSVAGISVVNGGVTILDSVALP